MGKEEHRRREIISATATLCQTKYYHDINVKEISKMTSMSRSSIYNYFETKEEIFLSMLEEEYLNWAHEINEIKQSHRVQTSDELAHVLAKSLADRPLMLKLIANNLTDFEENSRDEKITSFKIAYGETLSAVDQLLQDVMSFWTKEERQRFIYAFFPFLFGINPYTDATERQKVGLLEAEVPFVFFTTYELAYNFLKQILRT
ncbi:TetR family transcriptional regulator [Enterococcus faecium]|uniref:TetR family transcriptional regulator n=1 Tax=Enterococcus faecium TaxID=1352 RepID=UPI000A3596A8|nr:TetR family transcriptional regulator [Enterococcus faecium]OTN91542.1 hypothetical protein A5809_000907 [Enterococcus faecium]